VPTLTNYPAYWFVAVKDLDVLKILGFAVWFPGLREFFDFLNFHHFTV
jgi:hypothetical protein